MQLEPSRYDGADPGSRSAAGARYRRGPGATYNLAGLPSYDRQEQTAGGETQAAFERRCIPAEPPRFAGLRVALRSKYTRASSPGGGSSLTRLVSRAPPRSRRSRGFHHRLSTAGGETHAAFDGRSIPVEPPRFAGLRVALRSKYTRASSPGGGSSLARLVSRAPRPSRRSRGFHHRLLMPGQ